MAKACVCCICLRPLWGGHCHLVNCMAGADCHLINCMVGADCHLINCMAGADCLIMQNCCCTCVELLLSD